MQFTEVSLKTLYPQLHFSKDKNCIYETITSHYRMYDLQDIKLLVSIYLTPEAAG